MAENEEYKKARDELVSLSLDLGVFHGKLVADMDLLRQRVEKLEQQMESRDGRMEIIEQRVGALERRFDKFVFGDLLLKGGGG
jgi:hypothetical protein